MVFSKAIAALLMVHGFTTQAQPTESASGLRLTGVVIDYVTHQPLPNARLFAKLSAGRMLISNTDETGAFLGGIPAGAVAVQVEKAGYRLLTLPLQSVSGNRVGQQIALQLPLIAIEQQGINRTYLQTQQTEYVQPDSPSDMVNDGRKAVQHGYFGVSDAIRNTPLRATVCFFYTRSGQKTCVDTGPNGRLSLDFDQADVIAVEATAAGYQRYEGNLIIDSLDGRSSTHALQLQRDLTILSVLADGATGCTLLTATKTYALTAVPGREGWFSTYEALPQSGNLMVMRQRGSVRQSVRLVSGLNYVILPDRKVAATTDSTPRINATMAVVRDEPTPLIRINSLPMIYFEQSSYKLRTDSKEVLKQVASYLKSHTQYRVQVTGHTDNVGEERLNKSLSEFRAAVVTTFLIRQGIAENQCTKAGVGSQQPIMPNDTEANKALNRRVSLQLITAQ